MPANRTLDIKFRPMIGRIFSIRKISKIPYFSEEKNGRQNGILHPKDLGDGILVLDENNTRVKIILQNGSSVWIGKYYLHRELKTEFKDQKKELLYKILNLVQETCLSLHSENVESKKAAKTLESCLLKIRHLEELIK